MMIEAEKHLVLCNLVSQGVPMAEARARLGLSTPGTPTTVTTNESEGPTAQEQAAERPVETVSPVEEVMNVESLTRTELLAYMEKQSMQIPGNKSKKNLLASYAEQRGLL